VTVSLPTKNQKTLVMKKRILLATLSFVFIAATAFVFIKKETKVRNNEAVSLQLLPRHSKLAYANEWPVVQKNVAALQEKIKNNPADIKSMNALVSVFLQEARVTGNYSYYNKAAQHYIDAVLEKEPANFEVLSFKTTIQLSKHQFAEALQTATELKTKFPYNAYVYGMLVDANVELGNYEAAVEAADKMISLRPDIRSYSRIAYLREIHGDINGAIEAMQMAVNAGAPGDETTEWCRVQTGKHYEQLGKMKEAKIQYTIAATNRENFPAALAGLARIATEQKNYDKALQLYIQTDSISADHFIKEGIAEIYELMRKKDMAKQTREQILQLMIQLAKEGNEEMELAHAYMGIGGFDKALEYALIEHKRRPDNIEANETMALVYAGKQDYKNALPYLEKALRTNYKKAELLELAALVYEKTGNNTQAKQHKK
jgi:tetratricopeptide (TPR) repeat protein